MKRTILSMSYLILFLLISFSASSDDADDAEVVKNTQLDTILDNKIEEYRGIYPDITFLVLKGGKGLVADMMTLDIHLGHEPVSLDYEHPPELRNDLMQVSANRILQMLQYGIPSAALFKADEPLEWQDTICVLTINPSIVASDTTQATESLLGMSHEFVTSIPDELRITPTDYLKYIIDHEVYHCLQSKYIGPQPMSMKELWGDYWHHLSELGADSYSLGMHIKEKGKITTFVTNVNRIRGTALSTSDPNHLTCRAIEHIINTPDEQIAEMSTKEVFALAGEIKSKLTMSYDEYLQFMASAVEAMRELGVDTLLGEDAAVIIDAIEPDPTRVKVMIERTRLCLTELGG